MIDRRSILMAGAAAALVRPAFAATDSLGGALQLRERSQDFLATLAPQEAAAVRFPFEGEVHRRWNFMGAGGFIKPGLRLEQMSPGQKDAAWHMLSAVLSARGLEKARDVMSLQQVLIELGNGAAARGPERFSIALFGDPAPDTAWALRFEGHHLTLTFTVAADELTGVTPSSFSVNPNRVKGGFRDGLVTLRREDDLARRLADGLTGAARTRAFFMDAPFRNIRALAGRESPFDHREGLAAADLTGGGRDLLLEIIDAYAAEHLAPGHAAAVRARLAAEDAGAVHFAFAGSTRIGEPAYYRIHGGRYLIEFAAVDDAAQHLHTIFHLT